MDMQDQLKAKLLGSFRYAYLLCFFLLLSGFFAPIITGRGFQDVFTGTIVLFVGLFGGILLYNGATKSNTKYVIGGFAVMSLSLIGILLLSWRDQTI